MEWASGLKNRDLKKCLKYKKVDYSSVVERHDLVRLTVKHIDGLDEAKTILEKLERKTETSNAAPTSSNTTAMPDAIPNFARAIERMSNMTPEQIKQQASAMKRNPSLVRQSNPHMAHMTNSQIIEAAEQMEALAGKTNLKEMAEKMKNMTPEQMKSAMDMMKNMTPEQMKMARDMMGSGGGGGGGGSKAMDPSNMDLSKLTTNLTDKQIETMLKMLRTNKSGCVKMLRNHPSLAGSLKGVSDEMLEKQLDMFGNMSAASVRKMLGWIQTFQRATAPFRALNRVSGGYALHICVALVSMLIYYIFFSGPSSAAVAVDSASGFAPDVGLDDKVTTAASSYGAEEDEFAFEDGELFE
eukprot:g4989.t1